MRRTLQSVAILLLASTAAWAQDPRYRSYGAFHPKMAYRVGSVSADPAREGIDFVTLGKLDGNDLGPYGGIQDVPTIGKRWTFLVEWNHAVPRGKLSLDRIQYEGLLAALGVRGERSKQGVLCQQMGAESRRLDALLQSFKASGRPAYIFEIANEPNLYPYFSPSLYAWYYLRWREVIVARAKALGVGDRVRLMPGGLWWTRGLPASILQVFRQVLGAPAADAEAYYREMLVRLGQLAGTSQPSDCLTRPNFAQVDERRALWLAARLIDIGNLHYYPWIHSTSSLHREAPTPLAKLWRHIAALRSASALAAIHSTTREVWLTEVGNINPLPEGEMVTGFAAPFLRSLESLSPRPVARWYWFKAHGEDPKFSMLDKVGNGLLNVLAAMPPAVSKLLGLPNVQEIAVALRDAKANRPIQGLADAAGSVRPLGRYYLDRARIR